MGHACSKRLNEPAGVGERREFFDVITADHWPSYNVWSESGFRSDAKRLRGYVEAYGLDPTTATIKEMDNADARLTCADHRNEHVAGVVAVMTWKAAVSFRYSTSTGLC